MVEEFQASQERAWDVWDEGREPPRHPGKWTAQAMPQWRPSLPVTSVSCAPAVSVSAPVLLLVIPDRAEGTGPEVAGCPSTAVTGSSRGRPRSPSEAPSGSFAALSGEPSP